MEVSLSFERDNPLYDGGGAAVTGDVAVHSSVNHSHALILIKN